ncbi:MULTISPECIES: adenylate/guanylate cyclase domain-containing protein [unclassified Bradyrhizobium]|uniref:adenylate/guanylate cyclase domain-containing protein n=1 Tax=unclassified Bradyrhizobium TaxID=2631580 RepID=UPI001CD1E6B0|nr:MULTISPECIES: adenylate/guanylate cyclase domain-containing protein [unclassified Bradyrhizobium]MCA1376389.1 adenylate/guanylate cyclase domain-containing protein [Bradyrhizobium sp. IC4060]MCA1487156.1 adenylate/guanylate cyclase domain-containing protein [Bradyrhizobium sp. IC4061]MCA1542949.1 adenylate/guanylate cyclase domain-containing protein [Bradyrhizobium sp. NBAIM32]
MNVDPGRQLRAIARMTVSIRLAVSALVLAAILLTAALCSLLWWRTAEAASRQLASTINEQIVAAVRKEVAAIVDEARAAHTAIRTLFLQNVLDTREADKREFVFLSQLQSQATISWVAFGWPDGSFFAAHKLGDRRLEMMEISLTDHPGERRVDEYDVVPGDIEFANRRFEPTDFRVADQAWFKAGLGADDPQWFRVMNHATGERPSIAFAGPIDVYQERQGVLAVIIEYTRLARFLSQLEVGRTGTAFIVDGSGELVAAPDKDADELHPAHGDTTLLPLARAALDQAGEAGRKEAWRSRLTSGGAAYEVALTPLPFPGWSLATVIPEAEFLGPVETTLHRLILGLAVGAVLAALASAMLARSVIAAPLSRVVGELRHVEAFALEQVRRHPSRLKEIASLSGAIAEMASGLSAFRKFIPADLVRGLLRQGVEAKPGGSVQELSVMFIDIAGFTGLSERLGDRVVPLLSSYLDLTSEIIAANGGTIDKFIGDAVMAFWGAPQPQGDHAARCCRAALACHKAIDESGLVDDLGQPLQIRIGINSGRMLVGNIGSELRLNYTVIGDAVNVASRLEGANKSYGTQILVGAATERLARGAVVTREVDSIAVYGREEGLSVHELIGMANEMAVGSTGWIADYERGLATYRARRFADALADFEAVLKQRGDDRPAELMRDRCRRLAAAAPDVSWRPVAALASK